MIQAAYPQGSDETVKSWLTGPNTICSLCLCDKNVEISGRIEMDADCTAAQAIQSELMASLTNSGLKWLFFRLGTNHRVDKTDGNLFNDKYLAI